jgi:alpha-mannosidase
MKDIHKVLGLVGLSASGTGDVLALNTLPWHRKEIVDISPTERGVACGYGNVLNVKEFKISQKPQVSIREVEKGVFLLENDQLQVKVQDGHITSMYDRRAEREVIAKGGKGNQLVIFDDKPLYWQAWDVILQYNEDCGRKSTPRQRDDRDKD